MVYCPIGPTPHFREDGSKFYYTVKGCECEWCVYHRAEERSRNRYRRLLAGGNTIPTVEETAEAVARVRHWHLDLGMPIRLIATAIGMEGKETNLWRALRGEKRGEGPMRMSRSTYRFIMDAPASLAVEATSDRRGGTRYEATGTVRRLQGMNAKGISFRFLGSELGHTQGIYLSAVARGERGTEQGLTFDLIEDVKALYEKYSSVDPLTLGHRKSAVVRLQAESQRRGWAPPACWDDDTIDDPNAIPDWTGACGSPAGYYRHRAADIPTCRPCKAALTAHKTVVAQQRKERNEAERLG